MSIDVAPDIPSDKHPIGYPSKGRHVGPAWRHLWQQLRALPAGEYLDGVQAAEKAAAAQDLSVSTARNLLSSARKAGILDGYVGDNEGTRGVRRRTYYRISDEFRADPKAWRMKHVIPLQQSLERAQAEKDRQRAEAREARKSRAGAR